jgi:hypothetical protein
METSNHKPELIVMLTHHDRTVLNALELFERLQDQAVTHWGLRMWACHPRRWHRW